MSATLRSNPAKKHLIWQPTRGEVSDFLRRALALSGLCLLFAVTAPAFGQEPPRPPESEAKAASLQGEDTADASSSAKGATLHLDLKRFTLANGLRVVLNPDQASASVAVSVTYDVGSKHERYGQSGFAHLFEHMMFQGSRNVEKGEHFKMLASRGGKANGATNKDRTYYHEVLPPAELELALWLEADRMAQLAVNRENFENQRAVVSEEYRMNYSGRAYALGYVRLQQLVFQGYWPYEHPTIGFIEDLGTAKYEWLRSFHRAYYAPDNAVLSISGKFDIAEANRLVQKHFADLRPQPKRPVFPEQERMPRQTSERLSVVEDQNARSPGLYVGYRIPAARTRSHRALELASLVLTRGNSSRLYQSLVIEKAAARRVASWTTGYKDADSFVIRIVVSPLSTVDTAMSWLDGEMKRLRFIGPSDSELKKAKAAVRLGLLRDLETPRSRAIRLGHFETLFGDASELNQEFTAYDDITNADIRQAATQYLQDTRRSIVEIYPPGWVRDIGPVEVTKTHVVKSGENLIRIASQYGTTAEALAKQNGLSIKKPIVPGQRLLVTLGGSGGKSKLKTHTISAGESLIGIAKRYGVTANEIADTNNISTKKPIHPGQQLIIPKASSTSSKSSESGPKSAVKTYTVKKGDNLIRIAKRYGVSASAIAKENGISAKKAIFPGQKLKITIVESPSSKKSNSKKK